MLCSLSFLVYFCFCCSGNPEGLVRATELADQLLQAGEFDVYQMSAEDIQILLRQTEIRAEDDELDALGKQLDDKNIDRDDMRSTNGKLCTIYL